MPFEPRVCFDISITDFIAIAPLHYQSYRVILLVCGHIANMSGKFRPPLLKNVDDYAEHVVLDESSPPAKKRRTSRDNEQSERRPGPQLVFKRPGISSLPRKPLSAIPNPEAPNQAESDDTGAENYYNVLWSVTYNSSSCHVG